MARRTIWHEEYWLLLVQLYLRKPVGVKPLYSRGLVDIAMELHIAPDYLYKQMQRLANPDSPTLRQLLDTYTEKPTRLTREIKKVREMKGFGHADEFYKDVKVNESWERMFKPVTSLPEYDSVSPAMLIMALNLYYQLVPATMVSQTPEVQELAKLIGIKPAVLIEVFEIYRSIDPALPEQGIMLHPLLNPCMQVWKRLGNESPERIAIEAEALRQYFMN